MITFVNFIIVFIDIAIVIVGSYFFANLLKEKINNVWLLSIVSVAIAGFLSVFFESIINFIRWEWFAPCVWFCWWGPGSGSSYFIPYIGPIKSIIYLVRALNNGYWYLYQKIWVILSIVYNILCIVMVFVVKQIPFEKNLRSKEKTKEISSSSQEKIFACRKCGCQVEAGDAHCRHCGANLSIDKPFEL